MLPSDPQFYRALLDSITDGVYFVDRERRILFWNEAAHQLTGYQGNEMLGRRCPDGFLCHVNDSAHRLCPTGCPLEACLADGEPRELRFFFRHKQGGRVPVSAHVEPVRSADGSIVGAVEIFSDDSAEQDARRKVEEMERLAFYDHSTQVPNRRFVEMSLRTALTEYRSHQDAFGLMMIDLNGLKEMNDQFGHAIGDLALREVARTLIGALRPSDIVGRWGGDEFVAIVHHVNSDNLRHLAERCRAMVAETLLFAGKADVPVGVSVSVGETLVRPADTAESLIKRADDLMYQDKTQANANPYEALMNSSPAFRISRLLRLMSRKLLNLSRAFAAREK